MQTHSVEVAVGGVHTLLAWPSRAVGMHDSENISPFVAGLCNVGRHRRTEAYAERRWRTRLVCRNADVRSRAHSQCGAAPSCIVASVGGVQSTRCVCADRGDIEGAEWNRECEAVEVGGDSKIAWRRDALRDWQPRRRDRVLDNVAVGLQGAPHGDRSPGDGADGGMHVKPRHISRPSRTPHAACVTEAKWARAGAARVALERPDHAATAA